MCKPEMLLPLERFRQELYRSGLGRRKDALFELLDAVLTAPGVSSLVRLSLAPAFRRRFAAAEQTFRFAKQSLGWTTARPRRPEAADRWSWLLALAFWQLWLARPLVADQRLPWERPLAPSQLTPGRVRRACVGILASLASPTRAVRRRGNAPGRRPGQCPGPAVRFAVARRPRPTAA